MSYIKEIRNNLQPIAVSLEGTKKILYQMENCICKIYRRDGSKGTGFFCKIPFNNTLLPVLITNYHILNEKDLENNIEISINGEFKEIKMDISRKKCHIERLDVTFIEIKPNTDKIDEKKNFMELDEEDLNKSDEILKRDYNKKSAYILHYPKEKLSVSYGLINNLENGTIYHFCNTEEGSSGCPILSLESIKVIGIHYGGSQNSNIKFNYGTFMKNAIETFNNNIKVFPCALL